MAKSGRKRTQNVNRDVNGNIKKSYYNNLSENWAPAAIKRAMDVGFASPFDILMSSLITDRGAASMINGVSLADLYNVGKWYAQEMSQYLNAIGAPFVKSPSFMRVSATTGDKMDGCNNAIKEVLGALTSRQRTLVDAACVEGLHTVRVDHGDLFQALSLIYQLRKKHKT
jgi:hypothetical protein